MLQKIVSLTNVNHLMVINIILPRLRNNITELWVFDIVLIVICTKVGVGEKFILWVIKCLCCKKVLPYLNGFHNFRESCFAIEIC